MFWRRTVRSLARAVAPALALAFAASVATAQWEVDPTLTSIDLWGQVYADNLFNNGPAFDPVPRLGPGQPGDCPPYPPPPIILPHADCVATEARVQFMSFPSGFFDFGNGIDRKAEERDPGPPVFESESNMAGYFYGDGLGARSLSLFWNTEINNDSIGEDFFTRGCLELLAGLRAEFDVPATTNPVYLRFDFYREGDADSVHECPPLPIPNFCTANSLPPEEDLQSSVMDVTVDIDGSGPFTLFNEVLVSAAGFPSTVLPTTTFGSVAYAPGPRTITVDLDVLSRVSATTQYPEFLDDGEGNFDGRLTLHVIYHDFLMDPSYMCLVPAAGPGPQYPFLAGRSEVTNQQYADFLNAAELDAGATAVGSHMVFGSDGGVTLADGTLLFQPLGVLAPESRIEYEPGAPPGMRYTVQVPQKSDPRSYGRHPVDYVSWYGALKFCNWLTLNLGLAPGERCYSEGPSAADWHPVSISDADWAARDLNPGERGVLTLKRGFRLPMDDLGTQLGYVGDQDRPYNEWYKAAAYDPVAPGFARTGPGGESVPAFHWIYGVGRDALGSSDANFLASGDPFDDDDAFVALYDGSTYNTAGSAQLVGNGTLFTSAPTTNPWGLHDMSGNVAEWGQDKTGAGGVRRALRGGSWLDTAGQCAASRRAALQAWDLRRGIGFRVVQSRATRVRFAGPATPY